MTAHEDKFREALIEYLRAEDCIKETSVLTHFMVIGATIQTDDPDLSSVIMCPSDQFPFAYQIGVLQYTLNANLHKMSDYRRDD